MIPPIPTHSTADEQYRLEAVRALRLLDTPPEQRFDRITELVKGMFDIPVVSISLIDDRRQWFKSKLGLEIDEVPLDLSFCAYTIQLDDTFIIEDTLADARFSQHPLVTGAPYIRFYAGKQLRSANGEKVGTLCIIDSAPRVLDTEDRDKLSKFAALAEREINELSAGGETLLRLEHKLKLAHVLEYAAEGIFSTSADGTIETVNPAACTIFQYDPAELIGKNIFSLVPAREQSMHAGFMARLRGGTPGDARSGLEVTGVRKGGQEFPIEVSFRMLEIGSRKVFTGLIRDITERKNHERNKSEFIASVSHELRTPLTTILGALAMLEEDFKESLDTDARQLVHVALLNSQRLHALVNDILDVEKIDAGMMRFDIERISLQLLLEEICAMNQPFAKKMGVILKIDMPSQPIALMVDHMRFSQVMTNLISNACKFSPQNKVVSVAVGLRGDLVRINVIDEGPGIPEEFRARIFQRFAQAQSARNNKQTGTGLGLSLAKTMVEKMHGTIGFNSAPGSGSTFFVEFQAAV
jgi:PAS domain S-box-containing protein